MKEGLEGGQNKDTISDSHNARVQFRSKYFSSKHEIISENAAKIGSVQFRQGKPIRHEDNACLSSSAIECQCNLSIHEEPNAFCARATVVSHFGMIGRALRDF
jgi:hypothetical protein